MTNFDKPSRGNLPENYTQILQNKTKESIHNLVAFGKLEDKHDSLIRTAKIAVVDISLHDLETAQRILYAFINAKKDSIVDEDKE